MLYIVCGLVRVPDWNSRTRVRIPSPSMIHSSCCYEVPLFPQVVESVRRSWNDLRSLPLSYRLDQLRALKKMVDENSCRFEEAVWKDLRKVAVWLPTLTIYTYMYMYIGYGAYMYKIHAYACTCDYQAYFVKFYKVHNFL